MGRRIGFDHEKELAGHVPAISERVARFRRRLQLEFGGKNNSGY